MNSKALFQKALERIKLEDREEARGILYRVFEHLFHVNRTDILSEKNLSVNPEQTTNLDQIIERLNRREPVQYILGSEVFYNRIFEVNTSVLIPRPETEELIEVVKDFAKEHTLPLSILDIGTGSGCIPITLSLELPASKVFGVDISEDALNTARKNSSLLQANVHFQKLDILTEKIPVVGLNVIVSNPPYVTEQERFAMDKNVLDHEPHLALFVPDSDPLLFYKQIVEKSRVALQRGGLLAMEINERFGLEVKQLLQSGGFIDVKIIKDISGKDRIVRGILDI